MTDTDDVRDPDDEYERHEDLDADQIAEDAADLFGADDHSPPAGTADAPPPPG